jgi:molecular chaperone GrpE|tara:strand:+ start:466 stop:1053 length:588 start_codon:yes stop_codon:yes gene_type:complete
VYRDFTMSDKKEKLEKENIESEENKLNGDSVDQAVADDSETDETIGTPSYEELFDKNEELEKLLLRANADLDNALKRTLSEVEKAHKYGTERLLLELLPIIDNLENALSNLSENTTKEDKEGIELTLKSFESTLDKFGMIPIYPLNEEFNPEKHEAVSMEQDKNKKDGFVGNIFQRGWELHSRVLRPARVTVIKN